jgi:alginate O-acetyltransferase complex protein AlgI
MLFNSAVFICAFLPITFLGFVISVRVSEVLATIWLAAASLFFYAYWQPSLIWLISASMLANYSFGQTILMLRESDRLAKIVLTMAVIANLLLITYFKYYNFFANTVSTAGLLTLHTASIILPIGISFFTFTQIAYLVDARRGLVKDNSFIKYILFVSYFPHLIAGPILHHSEMIPQFRATNYSIRLENIAVGLTIFIIGLGKKVVLADTVAPYANLVFDQPSVTAAAAWGGVLAYTLQIYFDFSGYSDMAIGLSYLFGIRLPLNFNSPYKAANIVDFWRRWHMTLSRFLRDYLYIALGGNRRGNARRYINLLLTMAIGGLWHGAAWTFVIWGLLHGMYLAINHLWEAVAERAGFESDAWYHRLTGTAVTFIAVVVAWVFFRASSIENAIAVLDAMCGAHGWIQWNLGWRLALQQPDVVATITILLLLTVVWFLPNSQEIMAHYEVALEKPARTGWLSWRPKPIHAVWVALLAITSVVMMQKNSPFLYFQF